MKLAICNETFEGVSWPDTCARIARHGYDGVEIAPYTLAGSVNDITPHQRREIRRAAEGEGLEVVGLHWLLARTEGLHLTHPDAEVRKRTRAYLEELVRFCADVGGRVLVFGSPAQRNLPEGVDFEKGVEYAREVFRPAAELASGLGVVFAYEPLSREHTNFGSTAREARRIIEAVNHPAFRLHLDAKAMVDDELPMPELIRRHADLLEHVHVNDTNLLGPGMGELDLAPLVTALKEVGYDGYLSVEVFRTDPGADAIAAESRAYLNALLNA